MYDTMSAYHIIQSSRQFIYACIDALVMMMVHQVIRLFYDSRFETLSLD